MNSDENDRFKRAIFSSRLKTLIKSKGVTYVGLGKILRVTSAQISDMANGKAGTSLERLYVLCKYFDISADYLLGLTDEPRRLNG